MSAWSLLRTAHSCILIVGAACLALLPAACATPPPTSTSPASPPPITLTQEAPPTASDAAASERALVVPHALQAGAEVVLAASTQRIGCNPKDNDCDAPPEVRDGEVYVSLQTLGRALGVAVTVQADDVVRGLESARAVVSQGNTFAVFVAGRPEAHLYRVPPQTMGTGGGDLDPHWVVEPCPHDPSQYCLCSRLASGGRICIDPAGDVHTGIAFDGGQGDPSTGTVPSSAARTGDGTATPSAERMNKAELIDAIAKGSKRVEGPSGTDRGTAPAPYLENGHYMVPVSLVAQVFGLEVAAEGLADPGALQVRLKARHDP